MERAVAVGRSTRGRSQIGPVPLEAAQRPAETPQEVELVLSSLEADQILSLASEPLAHLHF